MPSTNTAARGIKGYIPALDPKVINTPQVVTGRNFLMSLEGPYAGFSSLLLSHKPLRDSGEVQTFETDDGWVWCTDAGIYSYDEASSQFLPLYTFTASTQDAPWSLAIVGGVNYYCRPGIGIIRYDPGSLVWSMLAHAELPLQPQYITLAYGRLIVVGTSRVAWSALDDGTDFTSSLTTGVGSQGLSMVGGTGLVVKAVSDGIIVFTTKGILKGQFTDIGSTFRWDILSTQRRLLSAFCVATVVDGQSAETELNHVFLDSRAGLFLCKGGEPKAYQPLMGEYIVTKVYPQFRGNAANYLRLHYSGVSRNLVLSIGNYGTPTAGYTSALVLYIPRDEWGLFNEAHLSFVDFRISSGTYYGDSWAYVCPEGLVHFMVPGLGYRQAATTGGSAHLWVPPAQVTGKYIGTTWQAASSFRVSGVYELAFSGRPAGYFTLSNTTTAADPDISTVDQTGYSPSTGYYMSEDWLLATGYGDWGVEVGSEDYMAATALQVPSVGASAAGITYGRYSVLPISSEGLNSAIEVGTFRLQENQYPDELSLMTNVAIGISNNGSGAEQEDWLASADVVEDWMVLSDQEDYGADFGSSAAYQVSILGYNDGNVVNSSEPLTLSHDTPSVEYYTCFNTAVFHRIRIEAISVNETFHLRYLELSGSVAGRL